MGDHNPLLDIPAEDYIGHMGSEAVGQLPVLKGLFADALAAFSPQRLLVLGCGTGNGFKAIDPSVTRRVTGVEINPSYLDILRDRFPAPQFSLDLICADAADLSLPTAAFDLVHAALIFEYVEWVPLVPKIAGAVAAGGGVSAVVQIPSTSAPAVTRTDYPSVRALEPLFRFVDIDALVGAFERAGFVAVSRRVVPLPQGKAFGVVHFHGPGSGSHGGTP